MRLIIIRHGEPDYANDCLTENGRVQAQATAYRLQKENISEIYSSPMGRAKETAEYTAKLLNLPINTLDFMHEIGWGYPEDMPGLYGGHPWTLASLMLSGQSNPLYENNWREHPYFAQNLCTKQYDHIASDFDEFMSSKGYVRTNNIYKNTESNDKTIALFCHGGSGACALSHMLNLDFPYVLSALPYGVCSISIIDFDKLPSNFVVPRIELFNDMAHLDQTRLEKLHFEM